MARAREKDLDRAWEYYKHMDSLLVGRVNYAMVAQSMLLASFATLFVSSHTNIYLIRGEIVIGLLGIFFAIMQLLLSVSLVSKMDALKSYLNDDKIFDSCINKNPGRPEGIQRYWIPVALVIVWLALICLAS
jgi:hypothetical protein